MFGVGVATKVYLAPGATDMRKSFEGLYGIVRDQLGSDPMSGHLFLFVNQSVRGSRSWSGMEAAYGSVRSNCRRVVFAGRIR